MIRSRIIALLISLGILASASYALAWTGPTQSPPAGNVSAPVNVGSTFQDKAGQFWADGGIGVNSGSAFCIGASCITSWAQAVQIAGGITGSGTAGYIPRFSAATTLANSTLSSDGASASANGNFFVSNGGVYIGTTNTAATARIQMDATSQGGHMWTIGAGDAGPWGAGRDFAIYDNTFFQQNPNSHTSPRFVIDFNGNVGIGLSDGNFATGGAAKLEVAGIAYATTLEGNYSPTVANTHGVLAGVNTGGYYAIFGRATDAGSAAGFYDSLGNGCTFSYGSTNWSCSSDARIKQNINDIGHLGDPLAAILSLRPVSYTMKADSSNKLHLGFLAQDVATVFPTLVSRSTATTTWTPDGTLALDSTGLIAPTVAAVQELNAKVDAQQKEIDDLKAQIAQLKR